MTKALPTPGYCSACYDREWKGKEIEKIKAAFAHLEVGPDLIGALEYALASIRFETFDHMKSHVPQATRQSEKK